MRRRSAANQQAAGVSLFPFLAVLLCTMGALIVVLIVIARHAQQQVAEAARRATADAAHSDLAIQREDLQWRIGELTESRAATKKNLDDKQLELSHLEEHTRRIRDKLDELASAKEHFQEMAAGDAKENESLKARLARLRGDADRTKAQIADLRAKAGPGGESYAIIPYHGPNETHRRPIYIECRKDGVVLQPEGIVLTADDFAVDVGPSNPLVSALRAARDYHARNQLMHRTEATTPYPLFIIRPDGIEMSYMARAAMISWGPEFGYELIGQDWPLEYPPPEPMLAMAMKQAVSEGRIRQAYIARAAPALSRYGSHATFRASAHGGITQVEGSPGGGGRRGSGRPHGFAGRRGFSGGQGVGGGQGAGGQVAGRQGFGGQAGGGSGGLLGSEPNGTSGDGPVRSIDGGDNPYESALATSSSGRYGPGPTALAANSMGQPGGRYGGLGNGGLSPGSGAGAAAAGSNGVGYPYGRGSSSLGSGNGQWAAGRGRSAAKSAGMGRGNGDGLTGKGSLLSGADAAGKQSGGGLGKNPGGAGGNGAEGNGAEGNGAEGDGAGADAAVSNKTGGGKPGGKGAGGPLLAQAGSAGGAGNGASGYPFGPVRSGGAPGGAGSRSGGQGNDSTAGVPGGTNAGPSERNGVRGSGGNAVALGTPGGNALAGGTGSQIASGTPGGTVGKIPSNTGATAPGGAYRMAASGTNAKSGSGPGNSDPAGNATDNTSTDGSSLPASPNGFAGGSIVSKKQTPSEAENAKAGGGTADAGSANPTVLSESRGTAGGAAGGNSASGSSANGSRGKTRGQTARGSSSGASGSSGSNSSLASGQASGNSGSSSSTQMPQVGGLPMPMPNLNLGQQNPQVPESMAKKRDRNWANPDASTSNIPIERALHIVCDADHLTLMPEGRGRQGMRVIPFKRQTVESVDDLVSTVWDRIDSWGSAGRGMYWRPVLLMEVEPGGQRRYTELQALLADSGFDVHGKPRRHIFMAPGTMNARQR